MTVLTPEDEAMVEIGRLAKSLVSHPAWEAYESGLRAVRDVYVVKALARGGTEFEKGAVFGLDLVLRIPHDTIETGVEVLARQQGLDDNEAADENILANMKEFAP